MNWAILKGLQLSHHGVNTHLPHNLPLTLHSHIHGQTVHSEVRCYLGSGAVLSLSLHWNLAQGMVAGPDSTSTPAPQLAVQHFPLTVGPFWAAPYASGVTHGVSPQAVSLSMGYGFPLHGGQQRRE